MHRQANKYKMWIPDFFKGFSDLFHPAAILAQIPIAHPGGGTNMDMLVGGVQYEQAVINKPKEGSELDLDGYTV